MNTRHCCEFASKNAEGETVPAQRMNNGQKPLTFVQSSLSIIRWILPGIVLGILPRCPICLAGYIAIATGVGVSITTAIYLRIGLILLCVMLLLYFVMKRLISLKQKE
jgi:hypothetical protein